jgi:hypothetical protein
MFNQLKLDFQKRNAHSFEQMMIFLNSQPHVMAYDYPTDKFVAYGEIIEAFFKPMAAGSTIQQATSY